MNTEKLNHNGPSLWVFIITAALALLLTGSVWASIEFCRSYAEWKKGPPEIYRKHDHVLAGRSKYSLLMRVILLAFLLLNRHWRWTWKTNAWISILSNDRYGRV